MTTFREDETFKGKSVCSYRVHLPHICTEYYVLLYLYIFQVCVALGLEFRHLETIQCFEGKSFDSYMIHIYIYKHFSIRNYDS